MQTFENRLNALRVLAVFLLATVSPLSASNALRSWTDVEGRTIQAAPIAKTEKEVRIRRDDGLVFSIPLDQLSEADRTWLSTWEPAEIPAAAIGDAVVIIQTPGSAGTGFLTNFRNGVYVVTNQHVIDGAARNDIKIIDSHGQLLIPERFEVSPTQDLARMKVTAPTGLNIHYPVSLDAEIIAYGNSRGGGVTTINHGKVVGIAENVLEVSAEIVQGNSGGPIVDENDNAIAVASFVARAAIDPDDWVTKGTRYAEPRRYAIRLSHDLSWQTVEWTAYSAEMRLLGEAEKLLAQAIDLASMIIANPTATLPIQRSYSEDLQEITRSHNQHVRRFESNIGRTVSGHSAVRRANQNLNANLRSRLRRISDVLEAEQRSLRAGRPDFSTPYLRERQENFTTAVSDLKAGLENAMNVERTFYQLQ